MSIVGNWEIQSHLLSKIIILITLLCNFQYSQCQSHAHLTNISQSSSSSSSTTFLCNPHQSLALLQFKSSFVIESSASSLCEDWNGVHSYPKTETWKEGTDCCSSWHGVTCHPVTGHVIGLDLSCSQLQLQLQLQGTMSSIFSLPSLKKLNLAFNDFYGSNISLSQFGVKFSSSLTHLNLSRSGFISGNIPSEISLLCKLVSLDLSWNPLQVESDGVMKSIAHNLTHLRVLNLDDVDMSLVLQPASSMMNLSSSLISLSLSYCSLQGNFPASFLLLPSLQQLHLPGNDNLKGPLPNYSWSGNGNTTHNSNLRVLDLSDCDFSGSIPASLGNLTKITGLDLHYNQFSGAIPSSIGNLNQLVSLDLSSNNFIGNVPSEISLLSNLVDLDMGWNMLRGPIPNEILNLTQLEFTSLSRNHLEGPLPSSPSREHTAVLFPRLQTLDLSENLLNATIPPWLFALPSLRYVNLYNNSFSGHLDREFVSQTLEFVDLSNNKLYGPLPRNLSKSVSLKRLFLSGNLLNGTIPSCLFALPSLTDIYLQNNSFTGHLEEFVSQSLEHVEVSNNKLSGPIPRNLFKSVNLTYLILDNNFLTGSIAQHPWSNNIEFIDLHSNLLEGPLPVLPLTTTYFSVSNNSFTGPISSQFCNATSLQILDLSFNKLFGLIPHCLGNISNLLVFNLRTNNFHGAIPDTFARGSSLSCLNLNGNQFRGMMPRSLINCRELQVLDLDNNLIEDVFPEWLGALPQLQVLVLRSNKFYGLIDIGVKINRSFLMLRILDLSNNNFSGALPTRLIKNLKGMMNIPATEGDPQYMVTKKGISFEFSVTVTMKGIDIELVKILTIFTTIDFSNNRFEGKIPKEIGNMHSLKGLNLSNNCLTGSIPSTIGKLVNLEWLDLSSNQLVGQIPLLLVDLNFLAVLNLSHNNLDGPIPTGLQFNTFKVDSYEGNTGLCGFPLPKSCGSGRLNPSSFQNKVSSDSMIDLNWKSTIVGYGCGMVFGIAMGYLVFSSGSPKWFIKMVEGKRHKRLQRSKRNVKVRVPRRN